MIEIDNPDVLDFPALVRPGDSVVCSQGLAEPVVLTRSLMRQREQIGPFRMVIGPTFSDTFQPGHGDTVRFQSYCGTGANAALHAAGVLDIVPAHYSDLPHLFARSMLAADVVLLTCSEPDAAGGFNLGLTQDYIVDAARRARLVIAEVSDRVPWVFGAELPPDVRPHIVVRTGREPLTLPRRSLDEASFEEREIARWVSGLIPDGATLELGIGTLPELVLQALRGHRDIGIHSGVIGDGVAELMQAGVVTNAAKPADRGTSVAGLLMGSRSLLDFAHCNPAIRLAPAAETHDVGALRALPNFIALNGAIEVDLGGQVNAESLNGRYIGAVGGQLDFVRGANQSRGGRSIMVLPSSAAGGTISRIVPLLADGVVTTPRSDVDVVVTEWGVAELRGKGLRERADAMIAIAHPLFREDLGRAARGMAAGKGRNVGTMPATATNA
ncbi:acetyl-CoA hydrolase/transferase family protein [Cupriavidus taiwanensis]|uniref:4-hydroxybutyrate CoA-transferase n=1 Tax=Cupriavidus taiwanensis TaxID=164546 RepID=A0A375JCZ3_9BURK|nr:acetyl-CoA hydrolase/transferase C-terminal domain-containing protein [Cupriavidus taiwanensis]SPS01843.1 4-hydroxybutyrate CoA-transferase [Cupriavidus taiwanensis]